MTGRPPVAPHLRFFGRVQQCGNCWRWIGGNNRGYGAFWDGRKNVKAHRWVYEYLRAEIPTGLEIDHLCQNVWCVNPWHMEPVTTQVNIERSDCASAVAARRTHCPRGHEYRQAKTQRICPTCIADRARAKEIAA